MKRKTIKNDIASHSCLEAILDTAVDGIITINSKGIIDTFNPGAEKLFGYSCNEVIGQNVSMLMSEPHRTKHDSYIERYETTGVKTIIGIGRDVLARHKNSSVFPISLSVGEANVDGKRMYVGIIHDISTYKQQEKELKEHRDHLQSLVEKRTEELSLANEELQRLASIDGLTLLANRRSFDEILQKELQRAVRYKSVTSLLMCDIDYFKQFNDTYGHLEGDECLKKVAACLQDSFQRVSDLPARYGGEEFAVILAHTNDSAAVDLSKNFFENIKKLSIPHCASDISSVITLSIGIATVIPDKTFNTNSLINAADKMLYKAKQNGRNRIEVVALT